MNINHEVKYRVGLSNNIQKPKNTTQKEHIKHRVQNRVDLPNIETLRNIEIQLTQ